jgi:hypothetical protein
MCCYTTSGGVQPNAQKLQTKRKKIFLSLSPFMLCLNSQKETKRREKERNKKLYTRPFHTGAPSPNHFGPRVRWRATVKTLQPPLEAFSMMFPSFPPLALLLLLLTLNWVMHSLFFFFFRTTKTVRNRFFFSFSRSPFGALKSRQEAPPFLCM